MGKSVFLTRNFCRILKNLGLRVVLKAFGHRLAAGEKFFYANWWFFIKIRWWFFLWSIINKLFLYIRFTFFIRFLYVFIFFSYRYSSSVIPKNNCFDCISRYTSDFLYLYRVYQKSWWFRKKQISFKNQRYNSLATKNCLH